MDFKVWDDKLMIVSAEVTKYASLVVTRSLKENMLNLADRTSCTTLQDRTADILGQDRPSYVAIL